MPGWRRGVYPFALSASSIICLKPSSERLATRLPLTKKVGVPCTSAAGRIGDGDGVDLVRVLTRRPRRRSGRLHLLDGLVEAVQLGEDILLALLQLFDVTALARRQRGQSSDRDDRFQPHRHLRGSGLKAGALSLSRAREDGEIGVAPPLTTRY